MIIVCQSICYSQIGGKQSFAYLHMPSDARVCASGGVNVSAQDHNPQRVLQNPALLYADMKNIAGIHHYYYYAGIGNTTMSYSNHVKGRLWAAGFQYMSYGIANAYDVSGNDIGTTGANDYAMSVSTSEKQGNFTLGATVKFAGSQFTNFSSYALFTDIGALFKHPKRDFTIGLVFKNIGFVLKKYNINTDFVMPFDAQLGFSYKLEHMPLRFSTTIHHLYAYDIVYADPRIPQSYDLNGNPVYAVVSDADKIARHFVFGGEFLFSKGFHAVVGYNHLRRMELKNTEDMGLSGFSIGFMLKVRAFEIHYTRAFYHAAGGNNFLGITCLIDKVYKKQTATPVEVPKEN
ncbi:MAG: type IX secretion system protein PorQ [Cytophagales bacterium]|nr:type IX secretion system protein PorQ [Cytophagales bacterium]